MISILFFILAVILIASALGVVALKNPMHSALMLILHMSCLAAVYAALDAHFLAVIQIAVYAGAIMVLVTFVLMLLNVKIEVPTRNQWIATLGGLVLGVGFFATLVPVIREGFATFDKSGAPTIQGSLAEVGRLLYQDYIFAFESTGLLLLGALVGAVMLARGRTN